MFPNIFTHVPRRSSARGGSILHNATLIVLSKRQGCLIYIVLLRRTSGSGLHYKSYITGKIVLVTCKIRTSM